MNQFTSREPFNVWVSEVTGQRYTTPPKYGHARYFVEKQPQTNPSNAILLNLRMDAAHVSIDGSPERFSEWLADETSVPGQYPSAQIEHARKVLTRLANLSGS